LFYYDSNNNNFIFLNNDKLFVSVQITIVFHLTYSLKDLFCFIYFNIIYSYGINNLNRNSQLLHNVRYNNLKIVIYNNFQAPIIFK